MKKYNFKDDEIGIALKIMVIGLFIYILLKGS